MNQDDNPMGNIDWNASAEFLYRRLTPGGKPWRKLDEAEKEEWLIAAWLDATRLSETETIH